MSYDPHDAAWEEFYERLSRELYTDHKQQAIDEFTSGCLRSYYEKEPGVMRPAIDALQEGKALREIQHYSAAVVFFVSSVELLLKATVLKPMVHGLIHNDALADIVVQHALGQSGLTRYVELVADLFEELARYNLKTIARIGATKALLEESKDLQTLRNRIIHQGVRCARPRQRH